MGGRLVVLPKQDGRRWVLIAGGEGAIVFMLIKNAVFVSRGSGHPFEEPIDPGDVGIF
jgi:hypothetical protein